MTKKTVVENTEVLENQVEGTDVVTEDENDKIDTADIEVGGLESTEGIKDESGNKVMPDESVRKRSIRKAKMPMTIREIVKEKAVIRFDLAEQRNTVWKDEQKSLFIHTLVYGYPFPTAFAVSTNDGNIWMLDGKQRTTTVLSYVQNEFKLHKNTPECLGVEIAGMYFKDLPEEFQNEILDSSFDIWELKNLTNAERAEMFYRLNNGSALTKLEVTRSMYSEFFSEVAELADLPFFTDVISLTNSARNRFVDQELVVQIAMLLDKDYKLKGFGGSHIRDYVLGLKESEGHFSEEMVNLYSTISTYLEEAFDNFTKQQTSKALKKINVPMVFMQAIEAKKLGMQPSQYGEFINWFLVEIYNIESAYGVSCQAGSAKRENVMVRLKEIDKAFKKYIKKHPIDKYKFVAPVAVEVVSEDEKTEEVKTEAKADAPTESKSEKKEAVVSKPKATGKRTKKEEKEKATV